VVGAHPSAIERLLLLLSEATDSGVVDELLDRLNEAHNLASEWDAGQWGFHPNTWMFKERNEMERRIRAVTAFPGVRKS
jgi:hypothetical protein